MNIWIDGSPALRQNQQGRISIVYEDGRTFVAEIGNCTVNESEYMALIEALRSCKEDDVINSDSELFNGTNAKLGHDYQFNLETPHAQQTLPKTLNFLKLRSQ